MSEEKSEGEILLVNKPLGWTSFQVVKKLKYLKKVKKAGHAGTLDPLATGLLIICTEKQTKKIQQIQDAEKEYTGSILLGETTPSYDRETEVNGRFDISHINAELIEKTLEKFKGEIKQIPPLHSAIKVDGKRAYKLARAGVDHTLEPRTVVIRELECTKLELPLMEFRVVCSKGTYIRSLANDLGNALGAGAHLASLVRTRIGNYLLTNALTPAEFVEQTQQTTLNMPSASD